MALSQNVSPTDLDWIHEIAKNELNPDATNIFNNANQFDPKQIIEETTIVFLNELRELLNSYSRLFNSYSSNNDKFSETKLYRISNTPADFMLFRNNVKMVFANTAHGIINISFVQHFRQDLSVDGSSKITESAPRPSQDMIAQIGPFLDVQWTFQGEKVKSNQLVKYYFIEFVKLSRASKKESTNQLLLKQIKALLQDKGINI